VGEDNTGIETINETNTSQQTITVPKKDKSGLFATVIIILVLILSGVGYFFLQQLRFQQVGLDGELDREDKQILEIGKQMTNLQSQMGTMQSQMASLQTSIANRESKFERELAEFKSHHGGRLDATKEQLQESIGGIHTLLGRTRGDWMVADARYLLTVANQRLHLVGDVKTSLVALKAADERLRESGNPGVFKVRESIAREITVLKEIEPLDVVGLSVKIRILQDQIAGLPVLLPHSGQVAKETPKVVAEKKDRQISSFDDLMDVVSDDISGLVVMRRSNKAVDAVLTPDEVRLIREELNVKLEFLRIAVIRTDSKLYMESLNDAEQWLAENFRTDAAETKAFKADLEKLAEISLKVDYPDISKSLNQLQNVASLRIEKDKAGVKPATKVDKSIVKPADKNDKSGDVTPADNKDEVAS